MNTRKHIKKILSVLLAITSVLLIAAVGAGAASNKPKDGKYNVTVNFWKEDKNQASMANQCLKHTARLNVKNGVMTMTIYTKPMTYGNTTASLREMRVSNGRGGWTQARVAAKDKNGVPTAFSFTVPSKSTYLKVQVNPHVKQMGNQYLDARLKISWDTLKAVK